MMEIALRSALTGWLAADPALAAQLNAVVEEVPSRTALPWLALAASASADWSAKDAAGREVRIALELHCRGDRSDTAAQFLRARAEQRGANTRVILLEYRFRLIAA